MSRGLINVLLEGVTQVVCRPLRYPAIWYVVHLIPVQDAGLFWNKR